MEGKKEAIIDLSALTWPHESTMAVREGRLPHRRDQQWRGSTGVDGRAPQRSCFVHGLAWKWSKGLREIIGVHRGGRVKDGVFIAWVLTHHSEIQGPEMRDVPHSMNTIDMDKIVGTWRRLSKQISGSGVVHRKVWTKNKPNLDKVRRSFLSQPRMLERDFLLVKLHTCDRHHSLEESRWEGKHGPEQNTRSKDREHSRQ